MCEIDRVVAPEAGAHSRFFRPGGVNFLQQRCEALSLVGTSLDYSSCKKITSVLCFQHL